MKITHSGDPSIEFRKAFYHFCCESKPFDFCSVGSASVRRWKIQEYLNSMEGCYFVEARDEEGFRAGAVFDMGGVMTLEFVFGNRRNAPDSPKVWQEILDYSFKIWKPERIYSVIQRKKNLQAFVRWIENNDSRAIIEGDKICWTNDGRV